MKRTLKSLFVLCALLCVSYGLFADGQQTGKKPLDHSVYGKWATMGGYAISDDGRYAAYSETFDEMDGKVSIVGLVNSFAFDVERGANPKFTGDNSHLVCVVSPYYTQRKEARIKKLKGDKAPKDTLCIVNFKSGKVEKFPGYKSYEIAKEKGSHIAFIAAVAGDTTKKKEGLFIYDIKKEAVEEIIKDVESYSFTDKGDRLVYNTSRGIYLRNMKEGSTVAVMEGTAKMKFMKPVFSSDETFLAFYANTDTTKKIDENVEIYTYRIGADKAIKVADNNLKGLDGMVLSRNRLLNFSKDNSKLFFGIAYRLPEKDTTLPDSEKAHLDVWHYNDTYIAPQQLVRVDSERKRNYLSYLKLTSDGTIDREGFAKAGDREFIRLAQENYKNVVVPNEWSSSWAYSLANDRYAYMNWNSNPLADLYIIDMETGTPKMIVEHDYMSQVNVSPDGKYMVWYNPDKKDWFSYSPEKDVVRNISQKIEYPLWNEMHDTPSMPSSYGFGGWRKGGSHLFIYDRYDMWEIDAAAESEPVNVTQGRGRELGYTLRLLRLGATAERGAFGKTPEPVGAKDTLFFTAYDNKSKGYGYFMRPFKGNRLQPVQQLVMEPDYNLASLTKARGSKSMIYVKSNFTEPVNMYVTRDLFKSSKKLTDSNPQQKEYNWGTCELVHWKSNDGIDLDGLLYKPEDFDPARKYPVIVYFYERRSQEKNNYRKPAVSRSTVNITYFVSNGYIVFIPDIVYTVGHPGKSAMNCIIPGVRKLCENSWVNSDKIAIQGQSWGGYQVAYMVTQTDMFACAGAGAPVSNMTSAYGGIRWGSGVTRQFQYEHTQSRIGCTPWDKGGLDLYIENSPLFFADKVNTPLLIMHNDKDEAVPWYQGIEYFTALRRLGKKNVWMLQYNGESHNLSNRVNCLDYTIRLAQFMDHFLKDKPMPVWMKYGIPATKKGIDYGLEIAE